MKFRKILPALFAVALLNISPARADFILVTLDGSDSVLSTVASIEMVFTGLSDAVAAFPGGVMFSDANNPGLSINQDELGPDPSPGSTPLIPGGGAYSGTIRPTSIPVPTAVPAGFEEWTADAVTDNIDSMTFFAPAGSLASTINGKTGVDVFQVNDLTGETAALSANWTVILRDAGSNIIGSSTVASSQDIGVILTTLDVTVVPVPGAVWLFGSALGLLGWIRRRAVV